ncbi:MAG TPA: hypothetical protein VKC62_04150 [Gaiellaceae bacterium]|nr:hypothetical protein [Gaiellaceae bacterium]
MKKLHVTMVAALLAGAAVFGAVAVTRTVSLGAAQRQASNAAVRAQARQLDRLQASLRKALAAKPKARATAAVAAPAPRIVYHRPPPIVVVRHSAHHGDDGSFENADGGGGGDG